MNERGFDPGNAQDLDQLRELAESAARIGGELAKASFGTDLTVSLKADRSEVTEVDIAAEQAVVAHIRAQRPHDCFLGEEGTADDSQFSAPGLQPRDGESRRILWIIDPIDGTRNYIRGVPVFVCSVAAMLDGELVAGAIHDPMCDAMYSAARGRGLLINGRSGFRLDRDAGSDREAKLLVGIPSARRESTRDLVAHAIEQHNIRNYGSAALHLAMVATGRLDAVVAGNGKLWDIAAGVLLITEAGGVVTQPDGESLFPLDDAAPTDREIPILAGAPGAHARLREGA